MKQIVINADPETHAWVQSLAKTEKRTMGNQVLALLGIIRQATPPKPAKRLRQKAARP